MGIDHTGRLGAETNTSTWTVTNTEGVDETLPLALESLLRRGDTHILIGGTENINGLDSGQVDTELPFVGVATVTGLGALIDINALGVGKVNHLSETTLAGAVVAASDVVGGALDSSGAALVGTLGANIEWIS